MRLLWRETGAAAFDDWLVPEALARLRLDLAARIYRSVLKDGRPGPEGGLEQLRAALDRGELRHVSAPFVAFGPNPGARRLPYPSGTALDLVIDSMRAASGELEEILGRQGRDWDLLGAGPKHYGRGGGMDWHGDERFVGTFVLYVHEAWEEDWGGELAFESPSARRVLPAPNRCVFIRSGIRHAVLPIAEAAAGCLRMSVIGYTLRRGPR